MPLLRSNKELRKDHIWNWTIPAWVVVLPNGKRFNCCPSAGPCVQYCYARNGTYNFRNVKAAHMANLMRVLDNPEQWKADMIAELAKKHMRPKNEPRNIPADNIITDPWITNWLEQGGAAVRIHDAGDFFSKEYLQHWLDIAKATPDVLFYCYTKEIKIFQDPEIKFPDNFRYIFSTGGKDDNLISQSQDRHADVFPNPDAITAAGYESQDKNDLLCILLNTTKVGITANNIPHFNKRLAGRRFSEILDRPLAP